MTRVVILTLFLASAGAFAGCCWAVFKESPTLTGNHVSPHADGPIPVIRSASPFGHTSRWIVARRGMVRCFLWFQANEVATPDLATL